ncbi:MAG: ethanolamine utilization microcompartment protein EutS [Fusobacteriaceae bacterium]
MRTGDEIQRVIQEYVPGKQMTLAHLIAHPGKEIYKKLGISETQNGAIGIMTITPGEASIIAADVALKSGDVNIGFLDRFSGTVVISGDVSSVESSLENVCKLLKETLKFTVTEITRS